MPHFDQYGGDCWICQAPQHKGDRIQNSRVPSQWRPDITGHAGAGNCCPDCIRQYNAGADKELGPLTGLPFGGG